MAATRRLAAIMFTDTVGYTASAQADEGRTLDLLRQQAELVRPLLVVHQGREIKTTGDGFLVEFDSALKATQCAVSIQRRIYERNSEGGLAPIQIRIGIHLGDVVQSGADILGDAVNIAARIEPIAEPGGICLSGAVYEQVRNKVLEKFEKLPPAALKGVEAQIDLYRVALPWNALPSSAHDLVPAGIAVLPFSNISPDPNDAYFADGLTEELISVLSQFRELRVIARTSVTPYKSTSKGVSQIGAELGVSSILEGSVRKAGNQLRITAQLIDVPSQGHVWANSYNRELDDVFVVQAELAKQVAEALKIELQATERAKLEARPAVRQDSYLAYLKGRTLLHRWSPETLKAAKEQFELAISLDGRNASAYSGLSEVILLDGLWFSSSPRVEWNDSSRKLATRALEIDPNLAEAHCSLTLVLWDEYQYVESETEFNRATALNPSLAVAHRHYGLFLAEEARPDEALREFELAEALDPLSIIVLANHGMLLIRLRQLDKARVAIEKLGRLDESTRAYHALLGDYFWAKGDHAAQIEQLDLTIRSSPQDPLNPMFRAAVYASAGRADQARELLPLVEAMPETALKFATLMEIHADLNDLDECFRVIEKAVDAHKFGAIILFRLDPSYEQVRQDPRFKRILQRMHLA
ncbi:MAG TPA: adenylate/guanylate cyclase domain-containing protein [Thermoplasmata archaeon]|nr:adenylate/guanylate cyclase domain-containing protein [Thermoplasmata archaeon]